MNEKEFESYKERSAVLKKALEEMGELCLEMELFEQHKKMVELEERLQQHRFTVGVMGEFRRGKSTVINSLLGAQVMPADIRPCSATMNRVTYGEEKKAVIHMKDGSQQEISFEELPKYVTKLDEYENESSKVDEAVVYFPSHFCEDGVDIVDTPGLNDDERMEKVSIEVIPKLDVMIMTLVPDSPFSISEARFVRDTLLTNDLSRMIFLVNKIDMVDEEERETLLATIKERIQKNTLDEIANLLGKESEAYINACKVLNHISIYAISARDSLKGKLKDQPELLKESGAVEFEDALTKMLTGERAALELGKNYSLLLFTGEKVKSELILRNEALEISEKELQDRQEKLEEEKKNMQNEKSKKLKDLDDNKILLVENMTNEAEECYKNLEVLLKQVIESEAAKWNVEDMSKPNYQALVVGNLQEKLQEELDEQMKAFTAQMLIDMERTINDDINVIAGFTKEFGNKINLAVHADEKKKIFDKNDAIATAVDVITEGVWGLGGVIAGARTAGVKGALVGGGIGFAAMLAIATVCPVVGLPLSVISCAGGTLASKYATKIIFKKDIAEKRKKELKCALEKSVEDTVKQISNEKQLENWARERINLVYDKLSEAMKEECAKILNEAEESLEKMKELNKTEKEEIAKSRDEFVRKKEECEKILSSVETIAKWLGIDTGKMIHDIEL